MDKTQLFLICIIISTILYQIKAQHTATIQIDNAGANADVTATINSDSATLNDAGTNTATFSIPSTTVLTFSISGAVPQTAICSTTNSAATIAVADPATSATITYPSATSEKAICIFYLASNPTSAPLATTGGSISITYSPINSVSIAVLISGGSSPSPSFVLLDNNGGTANPQEFTWTGLPAASNYKLQVISPNQDGQITTFICHSSQVGDTSTASGKTADLVLSDGEAIICEYSYETVPIPDPEEPGTIIINLQDQSGGTANDCVISLDGSNFSMDDPTTDDGDSATNQRTFARAPGTYTVAAVSPATGRDLNLEVVISSDASDDSSFTSSSASLDLNAGEVIFVKFTQA